MANHPFPISVLLIDDQMIIAEAIRRMLLEQPDITLHYCNDPEKALSVAAEVKPTVILQDLVMPQVDGLTLVRYFRANPGTQDVPLIVLSTKEEPKVKAEAFALGANDYLVKLPDQIELIARIRYHSAAYTRLLERNQAYAELHESKKHLQSELAEAAQYVRSLFPDPIDQEIKIDWRYIPSEFLGGDAFDYEWFDKDHLIIYLLDVCGHGVGAALLSITIMNALRARTLGNINYLNPTEVLLALNRFFPMEKHNNMFFTMWYGVYDKTKREITYSTAGHPPAILVTGDTTHSKEAVLLRTEGIVIGAMAEVHYENRTIALKKENKLYIFSDGIYELEKPNGKMLELAEYIDFLEQSALNEKDALNDILNYVKAINKDKAFIDDVSIVEIVL